MKNVVENNEEVSGRITPSIIVEYFNAYPEELQGTLLVSEAIERLDSWSKGASRNKNTLYTEVYADMDFDVDVDFDDVVAYIDDSDNNAKEIAELVSDSVESLGRLPINTLADEMKAKLLQRAFEKFDLGQLERRLGIKY